MPASLSRLIVVLIAAMAWLPVRASAQAWVDDPQRAEGRGLRLGEFALHPGVGAEVGYDSNVFLADADKRSSGVLRVSPHLYLQTVAPEQGSVPRVKLRTGATGRLKHWFVTDQGTDMGVVQELKLVINPERVVSLELMQQYDRTIDPFVDAVDTAGLSADGSSAGDYDRDRIAAGAKLVVASRGNVLRGGLGYRIDIDHFEGIEFANNRNRRHTFSADTVYEFLPKTGVFWDGSVALHRFVYDEPGILVERNNGTLIATRAGLKGALSSTLGFTLAAGYGAGLFDNDNDYENVLGAVELRWRPGPPFVWHLGYDREYDTAFQGNFARIDRVRTKLGLHLGTAVVIGLRGEISFISFGDDPQGTRRDVHLLTRLDGEYRVLPWLAFTGEVGYLRNFTDFEYTQMINQMQGDPAEYDRFEVWGGMRAFW
jgi:hypothetical protein